MNILLLPGDIYPDFVGGREKAIYNEALALAANGHKITIIAQKMYSNLPSFERIGDIRIFRHFSPSRGTMFYRTFPLFSIIGTYLHLRRLLRQDQFDLINAHLPFTALGALLAKTSLPLVYTFHSPFFKEVEIEAKGGKFGNAMGQIFLLIIPFIKALERIILDRAEIVITRSVFSRNQVEGIYHVPPYKIRLIPLGVDVARFQPSDIALARDKLGLPQDKRILLTVRRLVKRMGLENLLEAMKILVNERSDVLLLIGGDGYLKESLARQIQALGLSEYVHLLGFIPENMLPVYYQAADLFVLPSTDLEGFGLVILEALASGVPVVGTPVGAIPEVLGEIDPDLVSIDTSPKSLAKAIIENLSRLDLLHLREKCRQICKERFSLEVVTQNIQEVFKSTCQR